MDEIRKEVEEVSVYSSAINCKILKFFDIHEINEKFYFNILDWTQNIAIAQNNKIFLVNPDNEGNSLEILYYHLENSYKL